MNVLRGGQPVMVRGKLLPAVASRKVTLQVHASNGWQTIARARTGSQGGFQFRYTAGGMGQHRLRVGFAGDRVNAARFARNETRSHLEDLLWLPRRGAYGMARRARGVSQRALLQAALPPLQLHRREPG